MTGVCSTTGEFSVSFLTKRFCQGLVIVHLLVDALVAEGGEHTKDTKHSPREADRCVSPLP
jgi:hypothetical protein